MNYSFNLCSNTVRSEQFMWIPVVYGYYMLTATELIYSTVHGFSAANSRRFLVQWGDWLFPSFEVWCWIT